MTTYLRKISDLNPGDLVDLEGDPYADPNGNPALESEYQRVEAIEHETPDCIAVWFEGYDCIGFPADHKVKVGGGQQ